MLQRHSCCPQDHNIGQVEIGKERWCYEIVQNRNQCAMVWIGHRRQGLELIVRKCFSQPAYQMAFLVHVTVGWVRTQFDSDLVQKLETTVDGVFELPPHRVKNRPKPGNRRAGLDVRAVLREHPQLWL